MTIGYITREGTTQKIAAIYLRVSTDDQADNNSISEQRRRCLEYAHFRGIAVPDAYIFEEDFSGTEYERPELSKVIKLIREGRIQAFIVKNSGRLTRGGAGHVVRFYALFRRYEIELHYAERGIVTYHHVVKPLVKLKARLTKHGVTVLCRQWLTARYKKLCAVRLWVLVIRHSVIANQLKCSILRF